MGKLQIAKVMINQNDWCHIDSHKKMKPGKIFPISYIVTSACVFGSLGIIVCLELQTGWYDENRVYNY